MTDYTWPSTIVPSGCEWKLQANTGSFGVQAIPRPGGRWACTLAFPVLPRASARLLAAFLARIRGAAHRILLPVPAYVKRGAITANCLVSGASQTGLTLICDGVEVSLEKALRVGDWISVAGRLYMVSADCDSGATGYLAIPLTHPLYPSPADNDPVNVLTPFGRFILQGEASWQNLPRGNAAVQAISLLEDIP